jgi:ABC-2 type transport system permease protein
MRHELRFLLALWKANLLAAMEYRASFLTQVIGMFLNDGFFRVLDHFLQPLPTDPGMEAERHVPAVQIGRSRVWTRCLFFGNTWQLVDVIINGQLDYYLSLPRPVLLHTLANCSNSSGLGDAVYGFMSFFLARQLTLDAFGRFLLGILFSATILISFLALVQSLAFWIGNAQLLATNTVSAVITFVISIQFIQLIR